MKRDVRWAWGPVLLFAFAAAGWSQQSANAAASAASGSTSQLPRLVKFSGTVKDANENPLTGVVGVTFALYSEQSGGAPLWLETQNVQLDKNGHYTILLGATKPEALPLDLFVSEQAQWLGVQPEGQAEQPRVLLVSAPYALKAGDAETIGGLPPSAFVLAAPTIIGAAPTSSPAASTAESVSPATTSDVTTTGGTVDAIPLFSTATNVQNSILTQTAATAVNVGGKLNLPATAAATKTAGADSRPLDFVASSFSSSTSTAVNQTFQWQAEPTANNTASPSGTLNLLYGLGATAPSETGLKLSNKGIFTFAKGQTFPGAGTITGITTASGSGLSGGGTSGTLSLSVPAAGVTNTMLKDSSLTVKAGTDLTGGGSVALGSTVTLNLDTTKVPLLAAANKFTANQTIVGTLSASSRVANGYGVYGLETATTGTNYGVLGVNNSINGAGVVGEGVSGVGGTSTVSPGGPGGYFIGFSAPSGSGLNGYDGVDGYGGNADPESPTAGGAGVMGLGGAAQGEPTFGDSAGVGGVFVGGHATGDSPLAPSGSGDGVQGSPGSRSPNGAFGFAGNFDGDVNVSGSFYASSKDFKIDHPLDPANKYLIHASVESSEMKNIYDGNITTDSEGHATVQLPEWFQVLNTDFRYQLTVIGQFAQAIVASEIENNQFEIRTSAPNVKVSWQVTGVRQDAYAKAHPLVVEQEKDARLRGFYIHPELYGAPPEKQIEWARHPQMMKKIKEMQARQQAALQKQAMPRN
jgi:hypothetical protein